jgi:hypothetical protein
MTVYANLTSIEFPNKCRRVPQIVGEYAVFSDTFPPDGLLVEYPGGGDRYWVGPDDAHCARFAKEAGEFLETAP